MNKQKTTAKKEYRKFYFIGGGIASLAGAAFLIRDGKIPGKNIIIFDESGEIGGSLDAKKFSENSYVMRGYRMFERKAYTSTFNLMSFIPSLNKKGKTLKDEFFEFNKKIKVFDKCRLIENGKKIEAGKFGLNWRDREDLIRMTIKPEASLVASQIDENFCPEFFKTNYWYELCTTFAFEPWHSAAELRRYIIRYMHEAPYTSNMANLESTPYNQYDSIVLPLLRWLKIKGVSFERNSEIIDIDFGKNGNAECAYYLKKGKRAKVMIGEDDCVLATIGSMTANSAIGSMDSAPKLNMNKIDGAWTLWKNISKKNKNFGKPSAFANKINKSKFEGFTITFQDSEIPNLIKVFTGQGAGHGGIITFKDSNWLISIIMPHQPHFINQPKNLTVCWGYSLFPDKKGNFVKKKMSDCTGREILTELFSHFRFQKNIEKLIEKSICMPSMLPYATSQFLSRKEGNRPQVIPKGSKNFAFIGQFCEVPQEITFTVEYSVRSAQIAVYSLLRLHHKIPLIYHGEKEIGVLYDAVKTTFN